MFSASGSGARNGFVRWLTGGSVPDPWFEFQGGGETMVYPGDRFGIAAPIASIRLKIQRNAVQDVTLLNELGETSKGMDTVRARTVQRFNRTELKEWWTPRPAFADKDPLELSNANLGEPLSPKSTKNWTRARGGGSKSTCSKWRGGLNQTLRRHCSWLPAVW